MPELDPFDARLGAGVRAFADRAETSVNAAAMAEHARRHRRTGRLSWLGVAVPVPVSILVVLGMLAAFAGWSVTGGGPFRLGITLGPRPLPSPTAAPTPSATVTPTPSPMPTVAPDAAAHVTGTGSSTVQSVGKTMLDAKGIAHTQGIVIVVTTETTTRGSPARGRTT